MKRQFTIPAVLLVAAGMCSISACRRDKGKAQPEKKSEVTPTPRATKTPAPAFDIDVGSSDKLKDMCNRFYKEMGSSPVREISFKYPVSHEETKANVQAKEYLCGISETSVVLNLVYSGDARFNYVLNGKVVNDPVTGTSKLNVTSLSDCLVPMSDLFVNFFVNKWGWGNTPQLRVQVSDDVANDVCPSYEGALK